MLTYGKDNCILRMYTTYTQQNNNGKTMTTKINIKEIGYTEYSFDLNNAGEEIIHDYEVKEIALQVIDTIYENERVLESFSSNNGMNIYFVMAHRTIMKVKTIDRNNAKLDTMWRCVPRFQDIKEMIKAIQVVDSLI